MINRRTFVKGALASLSLAAAPTRCKPTWPSASVLCLERHACSRPVCLDRSPGYPRVEEKAAWMLACRRANTGLRPRTWSCRPVTSSTARSPITGTTLTISAAPSLEQLPQPFLPCVGNHENRQGEGMEESLYGLRCVFWEGPSQLYHRPRRAGVRVSRHKWRTIELPTRSRPRETTIYVMHSMA